MVAGDLVNTASRIQAVAEPGQRLRRRVHAPRDRADDRLRGRRHVRAQGQGRADHAVAGASRRLRASGLAEVAGARGAVRRPRPRAAADQGPLPRERRAAQGAARLRQRHRRDRQVAARLGVLQVLRRPGRRHLLAPRPLPRLRRGRHVLGARRDGAHALHDRRGRGAGPALAKLRATLDGTSSTQTSGSSSSPGSRSCSGSATRAPRTGRTCSPRGDCSSSGSPTRIPTVLVFEDMQWADTSLLDFVEYLLEWSRNSPIFVITLARPELTERRRTGERRCGTSARSTSSRCPHGAMEELLTGLVPGLPKALREKILARAEGIPLYAVETVRMLLDRGALVQDGPVYRVVGEVASLEVPETLHALIAARLDGLADGRAAAAPGRGRARQDVHDAGAGRLERAPGAGAGSAARSLVHKEVLGVQADPRSPEHGQYGFLQDLLRRVAYETLSKRDRRARHLAAAEQLGATFGEDEIAEVVAFHLLEPSVPRLMPMTPRRSRRARAWPLPVRATGQRRWAAAAEAQRYFAQAAELGDDPSEQTRLDRPSRPDGVSRGPDGRGADVVGPRALGPTRPSGSRGSRRRSPRSSPTSTSWKGTRARPSHGWRTRSPR